MCSRSSSCDVPHSGMKLASTRLSVDSSARHSVGLDRATHLLRSDDEIAPHESSAHDLLNDESVLLQKLQVGRVEVVRVHPDLGVPEAGGEPLQVVEQLAAHRHVPALPADHQPHHLGHRGVGPVRRDSDASENFVLGALGGADDVLQLHGVLVVDARLPAGERRLSVLVALRVRDGVLTRRAALALRRGALRVGAHVCHGGLPLRVVLAHGDGPRLRLAARALQRRLDGRRGVLMLREVGHPEVGALGRPIGLEYGLQVGAAVPDVLLDFEPCAHVEVHEEADAEVEQALDRQQAGEDENDGHEVVDVLHDPVDNGRKCEQPEVVE
ncbi:pyruvate kinase, putative [Babesia caballi]|uniref:Pyruvate kinase, putative n=1 Tax=Babesia caballi TaxID=5871 RepID=A0AAV4LNX6_BABCB|nr:pyruvate kinase, putative [Babesia caballi]